MPSRAGWALCLALFVTSEVVIRGGLATCNQSCASALLQWSSSISNWPQIALANNFSGWYNQSSENACSWTGIACQQGLVNISLGNIGLVGSFDSSWDDLGPYLLSIKVDGSQLPDQLPPSWGQAWPNVQAILICSAGLRSTLPPEWGVQGAFASLVTLKLWANPRLRGSLPPQWGQQGSLQKLVLLDVSKASLTGSLPAIWATQMPKLGGGVGNGLWFEDNQLTGQLPVSWAQLPLAGLELQQNRLTGKLPPEWGTGSGTLSQVYGMNLSYNALTGPVPAWGGPSGAMNFMNNMDLSHNRLTGTLPQSLNSLVNLEYFAASTNLNVCGTVATLGNYSAGVNPLSYSLGSCARSVAG